MMKKTTTTIILLAAISAMVCSCGHNSSEVKLNTHQDTLSWAMGMSLAQTAKSDFYKFDKDKVIEAFECTMNDGKQPLDQESFQEACEYIAFLVQMNMRNKDDVSKEQSDKSQEEYFAKLVSDNPNVKKSEQGFYYEVLKNGHGVKAKVGKRVKFDFKGTEMLSGNLIEQTYGVREPIIHVLGKPMFEGLVEGIELMNAGSKYRFYFPYEKVTGANGIAPYTPVIYEVELHEIYDD